MTEIITDEQVTAEAIINTRKVVTEEAGRQGLTLAHALMRIKEATDATVIKAQLDTTLKQSKFKYSKPLPDNSTRLAAAKVALEIHDAMPSEKHDVNHNISGKTMSMVAQILQKQGVKRDHESS